MIRSQNGHIRPGLSFRDGGVRSDTILLTARLGIALNFKPISCSKVRY
jgi:hypothetical protein